jgi:hypothetical protein
VKYDANLRCVRSSRYLMTRVPICKKEILGGKYRPNNSRWQFAYFDFLRKPFTCYVGVKPDLLSQGKSIH